MQRYKIILRFASDYCIISDDNRISFVSFRLQLLITDFSLDGGGSADMKGDEGDQKTDKPSQGGSTAAGGGSSAGSGSTDSGSGTDIPKEFD